MGIYKIIGGSWVTLDKLIKIEFENCHKCEEIPMLGYLPLLKYLRLYDLNNVTSIRPSFYGQSDCSSNSINNGQETSVSFPSLECLTIEEMSNLAEWEEAEMSKMQVFPCLKYLIVYRCGKLTRIPHLRGSGACLKEMKISYCEELRELHYDLGSLQSLERLEISDCRNLESVSYQNGQKGLSSLQSLKIDSCHELSNLPNEMLECCKSLQHLTVSFCNNLTSLPELKGMGSLQQLNVSYCNNLTSFPELKGIGSLQHLEVSHCNELTSFPELKGMGSLQHLEVFDCGNLTLLPELSGMGSLQRLTVYYCNNLTSFHELKGMRSLHHLQVRDCVNLTSLPELSGMGCHNSIRELLIGKFSNSMQFNSFQDSLDGIKHMIFLEKLCLFGQANWVSLPDQLQYLTSLKQFEINNFGMEALPEWFGNLLSLEELLLTKCEKLRHLPSKETMQRLTKLKGLQIWRCQLLGERCWQESGPDSELPKISRIPRVRVAVDGDLVYSRLGLI